MHEPWRDEAQAWLIARDLPWTSFFQQANYEGTPFLWHVMLRPLVLLGAPYVTMHVVHVLIACAAMYLWLFKSPFQLSTRLLFLFSYFPFWEYAVLARNYSLSMLLLFTIACLFSRRKELGLAYGLLVALLFNANVHSMGIAFGLSLLFVYDVISDKGETRQPWAAMAIMAGGFMLAVIQLLPAADNMNQELFSLFAWKRPFIALVNAFLPGLSIGSYIIIAVVFLYVALTYVGIYFKNRGAFLVLVLGMGWMFYIFIFKHVGSLRHHGLLLILLLFVEWISPRRSSDVAINKKWYQGLAINVCFAISMLVAMHQHVREHSQLFSGAEGAAHFIQESVTPNAVFVAHPSIKASALLPYLEGRRFWYADVGQFATFVTWNEAYGAGHQMEMDAVITKVESSFSSQDNVYLLTDKPIPFNVPEQRYLLVYQTTQSVFGYGDEVYFLYRRMP